MREISFCTVATASHLRYAIALNRAIRRYHSEERLVVLLVDPPAPPASAVNEIEVLTPEDVAVPEYEKLKIVFDAFALSNNLKPYIVDFLLRTRSRKVILLDADILVTGPLDSAIELLERCWLTLTPHVLKLDLLEAGSVETDQFVRLGTFNGGMWGLRSVPEAFRLLEWLKRYLVTTTLPHADQKVLPLAAQLAGDGFAILSDPVYNVAYWNLHERRIEKVDGGYFVDGRPATFFHLSGFDDRVPDVFSKHRRVTARELGCYRGILAEFVSLIPPEPELRGLPYRFNRYGSRPLTPEMRQYFQKHETISGYRRAQLRALLWSAYGRIHSFVRRSASAGSQSN